MKGLFILVLFVTIGNLDTALSSMKDWTADVLINSTVSVDRLFMISGVLTVYLMLNTFERTQPTVGGFLKSVPITCLHRFIRSVSGLGKSQNHKSQNTADNTCIIG